MCGFAGIFQGASTDPVRLGAEAAAMAELLRHRGPDDDGVWTDPSGRLALAFRRLAILDLSPAGHQPMTSRSGRFTLVFNGEVYNFEALRDEVGVPRSEYRGGSDTEVLLAAFEGLGVLATLERIIGMFAIALWDERERELWLIRDRMGIKPLYLARTSRGIAFASELGALTRAPSFDGRLDPAVLSSYLRYLYVPGPGTPFASARKIPPGHFLTLRSPLGSLPEPQPYWTLDEARSRGLSHRGNGSGPFEDEERIDAFDALLSDAVGLRLVADVPVGALLSGGIDSSLVVALMQEQADHPVRTFTVGFDHREHDESVHARAMAKHLGTEHTELRVGGADALALVPELPRIFDEPLADPSQIPTYLISALARRSVTVALSGDGGDELFAGYNRYRIGPRTATRLARIPAPARHLLASALRTLSAPAWDRIAALPALLGHAPRLAGQKTHKLARMMESRSPAESYQTLMSFWDDPDRFLTGWADSPPDPLRRLLNRSSDPLALDEMLFADQCYYLPDDLLQKVDRASMAVSLEVRVPLLDHRIVEESWALGDRFKLRDGGGKWLLRQLLLRRLPSDLIDRPKTGFSVPVEDWLAGPLREWSEELLLAPSPTRDALLNRAALRDAWKRFLGGRTELALGIWSLVMLEAWRRQWKIEDFTEAAA